MIMEKIKPSVTAHDPTGQLYRDVIEIARFHVKNNPDNMDLRELRKMDMRSGITAVIRYLVDKEKERLSGGKG